MPAVDLRTISGQVVRVDEDEISGLAGGMRGRLVRPGDAGYDGARAVWNGMIDRHPGLLARCAGVADVISCVQFAGERGLLMSVRGGGHNVAGTAVCDGGLVVDLSGMTSVRVDPATRTVRAEGGVTIGDLDHETQPFGLAVPMGVVTATGIAGLTLGGGLGWLRRRYGLSCDNLLAADVVTADCRMVRAAPDADADLLWGLRGGGGNFGVVTSFEFAAHPVGPEVFFAFIAHAGDDARAVLRDFARWAPAAPDEVSAFAILWHAPAMDEIPAEHHQAHGVVLLAMHCGDPADGAAALRQLRDLGTPLADLSATVPYTQVQRFFDADYPAHEMRYYWRSRYLSRLDAQVIDELVALNEASPSPHSTLDVWQLGGQFARVGPGATAFGDRSAPYLVGIEANWERAEDDAAALSWARDAFDRLTPFSTGGEYVNFPGLYEDTDHMVRDTFAGNLDRLRALKKRYDPANMFRFNHNIPPG